MTLSFPLFGLTHFWQGPGIFAPGLCD